MSFPDAEKFLRQTGSLSRDLLQSCEGLAAPPAGFERIWAAFDPLEVMQKRGQIVRPRTGEAWQLLCDEGAGMGGTDWAPPPLAYFAAGMACSVTGAVVEGAGKLGIPAEAVSVALDNHYSLSGSILRGTMEGTGDNADVAVAIDGASLSDKEKSEIALNAVSLGLAGYLMKSIFVSEFGLAATGAPVSLDLPHCDLSVGESDLPTAALFPVDAEQALVAKAFLRPDDPDFTAGSGSGLDTVQKRAIKVSATAKPSTDGVITIEASLARPNASIYRILGSSDAGAAGAPSSACLIAAGIGFCFMTQLGRYAEAIKHPIEYYRMIQAIDIPLPGADGSQTPVIGTKLFLDLDQPDDEFARDLTHSAKRTCFLHSTLQTSLRCRIR